MGRESFVERGKCSREREVQWVGMGILSSEKYFEKEEKHKLKCKSSSKDRKVYGLKVVEKEIWRVFVKEKEVM